MKQKIYLCLFLWLFCTMESAFGASNNIRLQPVSKSVDGLYIEAFDTNLQQVDENVYGKLPVSINGLELELHFRGGKAKSEAVPSKTGLIYLSSDNYPATAQYIYCWLNNTEQTAFPVAIPVIYLLVIPILLIIIGFFIKRLVTMLLILAILYFLFIKLGGSFGAYEQIITHWISAVL